MSLLEENAAILRDLEAKGRDLAFAREVDFSHVFIDQAGAEILPVERESSNSSQP